MEASRSPELERAIESGLAFVHNRRRALHTLERLLAAAPEQEEEIIRHPEYARLLLELFWHSPQLSDLVRVHPEYFRWRSLEELRAPRTREQLMQGMQQECADSVGFDATMAAMRRFRQKELLRISLRDVVLNAPMPELAAELSDLADAAIEEAIAAATLVLGQRYGAPMMEGQPCAFTVLGMGKLGAQELNYSSDIDLLFLYGDEGGTAGGERGRVSLGEYFQKLGELIIKALAEPTADGFLFRVDMRLRPFGEGAPLAVTLEQALQYYAEYGRAWERQALLKARPCAGEMTLGKIFIERMRPFVFPQFFDDQTLEDIRQVKMQTEARTAERGETLREVKLGRGGIRDIEFTVQILQLLHGGRLERVRARSTLEAIKALGEAGILRPLEAEMLASHYVFLRRIEHRLQIESGRQVHALPAQPEPLQDFAVRLGYEDAESFLRVYQERAELSRAVLSRFLGEKGGGTLWVRDLLNPFSDACESTARLEEAGFGNPKQARKRLLELGTGTERNPFPAHVRRRFEEIAPDLLRALAQTAEPDAVLSRLAGILMRAQAPGVVYELLKYHPPLHRFLVQLAWNSDYLSNVLIRDPGLLDILSEPAAFVRPATRGRLLRELELLSGAHDAEAALYRLRDGELLRIAMRELVLGISVAEAGDELTLLAEVVIAEVLQRVRRDMDQRHGRCEAPFAILGLGKLGGWEMGYGSDLDLLFVYGGNSPAAQEHYARVAARVLNALGEPTRHGQLYEVDARLRPDGAKGVLAISEARLHDYFAHDAQEWERFALMKVRFVAGDEGFGSQCEAIAKDVAFGPWLDGASLEHFELLRKRMVQQADPLDIKKCAGGISEIEYTVRFWQLRHVRQLPALRRGDVFGATDILAAKGLIDSADIDTVRHAYTALRWVLNRIRMMDGRDVTALPADMEAQRSIARRLGLEESLLEFVERYRQRAHALYEKALQEERGRL